MNKQPRCVAASLLAALGLLIVIDSFIVAVFLVILFLRLALLTIAKYVIHLSTLYDCVPCICNLLGELCIVS